MIAAGFSWESKELKGGFILSESGFRAKLEVGTVHRAVRFDKLMSTALQTAPPQTIFYPDDDGKPMSDNTWQFQWIVTIAGGLERCSSTIPTSSWRAIFSGTPSRATPKSGRLPTSSSPSAASRVGGILQAMGGGGNRSPGRLRDPFAG